MTREELFAATDKMAFCRQELNAIPNGKNEVPYCCFFHKDSNPSATFNVQSGLFNCHGCGKGGSQVDIIMKTRQVDTAEAFRILEREYAGVVTTKIAQPEEGRPEAEVAPREWFPKVGDTFHGEKITAVYEYYDEQGGEVSRVARTEGKKFPVAHYKSGAWYSGHPASDHRVLYALQGVLAGIEDGATVYLCEGEKDADSVNDLEKMSAVGTTWPGGKNAPWQPQFTEALRGADVVLIHDKDADGGGQAKMRAVAVKLQPVAKSVRIVEARTGKDVSDHIQAGRTLAELVPVEMEAPEPVEPDHEPEPGPSLLDMPVLPEECWRPGFCQFREAYSPCSECSDTFLFGAFLGIAGAVIGRNASLKSAMQARLNFYIGIIGESGRSRKTTGQNFALRMLSDLIEACHLQAKRVDGISTAEGLTKLLSEHESVVVTLNELATLFTKGATEGSRSLLPFLTAAFDADRLDLPTKNDPLTAEKPHLTVIGASVKEWLHSNTKVNDIRAGLSGRFLYFVGKEKAPIPFPPMPDPVAQGNCRMILADAAQSHQEPKTYTLTTEAKKVWADWYTEEKTRKYPGQIIEILMQRLHLHTLKLAMVYAALEGADAIGTEQLTPALAFAEYQRQAVQHVYGDYGTSETTKIDDRICSHLARYGRSTRKQIVNGNRDIDRGKIDQRLPALERLSRICKTMQEGERGYRYELVEE